MDMVEFALGFLSHRLRDAVRQRLAGKTDAEKIEFILSYLTDKARGLARSAIRHASPIYLYN